MNTISINISRLEHLLKLYRLSFDDILVRINEDVKKPIAKKDITNNKIKLSHLKKIDKIFNRGLNYYIDPKNLGASKNESIFFRKNTFNVDLNLGAKQIVNHFEQVKIELSALTKLSDLTVDRVLPIYTINSNPKDVAKETRKYLYPDFNPYLKEFLKSLINKFAEFNILVFEFIESWNKRETANINGFFLGPNVIVLKRQQKSFRREIFTLVHELGHYLINDEEIDDVDLLVNYSSLSKVERWCNDFTYYFLMGDYESDFHNLGTPTHQNDYKYDAIEYISRNTNLSKLALFTRLLVENKISSKDYNFVKEELYKEFQQKEEGKKAQRENDKLLGKGKRASAAVPIKSPLYIDTLQIAYLNGLINEFDLGRILNVNPKQIGKYLP